MIGKPTVDCLISKPKTPLSHSKSINQTDHSAMRSSFRENSSSSGNNVGRETPREIQEDGPAYRSAMIEGATPSLPLSFAALPSPKKLTATRSTKSFSNKATAKSVMTSTTPSQTSAWKVSGPTPLPYHYLLERTNVYVDNATAQVCADRICECLYTHNIAAQQGKDDDDKDQGLSASNLLLGETQEGVKFAVRLFSDQGKVIVEMQRRGGCSFSFRDTSRLVLRSAQGLPPAVAPKRKFTVPPSLPQRSRDVQESCVRDDFELVLSMLRSERLDAQMLALDILEQITKTCGTAEVAAKLVLGCECLHHLMVLLEENVGETVSAGSRKIFAILANACSALDNSDLLEIISSREYLKTASFLSHLLSSLGEASDRAHNAYQAAKCLQALLVSKEVENAIVQMSCMEIVETACRVGSISHHALHQESQMLLSRLRNVCC
jgi:hypothetical protein